MIFLYCNNEVLHTGNVKNDVTVLLIPSKSVTRNDYSTILRLHLWTTPGKFDNYTHFTDAFPIFHQ